MSLFCCCFVIALPLHMIYPTSKWSGASWTSVKTTSLPPQWTKAILGFISYRRYDISQRWRAVRKANRPTSCRSAGWAGREEAEVHIVRSWERRKEPTSGSPAEPVGVRTVGLNISPTSPAQGAQHELIYQLFAHGVSLRVWPWLFDRELEYIEPSELCDRWCTVYTLADLWGTYQKMGRNITCFRFR